MSAQFAWFIGLLFFISIWTFSAVVAAASVDKQQCNIFGTPYQTDMFVKVAPPIPNPSDNFTVVSCEAV